MIRYLLGNYWFHDRMVISSQVYIHHLYLIYLIVFRCCFSSPCSYHSCTFNLQLHFSHHSTISPRQPVCHVLLIPLSEQTMCTLFLYDHTIPKQLSTSRYLFSFHCYITDLCVCLCVQCVELDAEWARKNGIDAKLQIVE